MNKSQFGGLLFLALFISYGILASKIPLDFFSEQDSFNARSLPLAISVAGTLVSLLLILFSDRHKEDTSAEAVSHTATQLNWIPTLLLVVIMIMYGVVLDYLGFLLATTGFLIAGYLIMGERRPAILLLASLPLVAGFWLILSTLGIYLSPGNLYFQVFGS